VGEQAIAWGAGELVFGYRGGLLVGLAQNHCLEEALHTPVALEVECEFVEKLGV
jgi:hypothetical protein